MAVKLAANTVKLMNRVHTGANCYRQGIDPELFFPSLQQTKQEKAIIRKTCGECKVRLECLELGKSMGAYGVWGGVFFRYDRYIRKAK